MPTDYPEGVRPGNEAELIELLRAPGTAFELVAGGSKRSVGQPLTASILNLSAFNGIVDYQPGELVLTARPGTPLRQIEPMLAKKGQRLGFEPPLSALL